MAIEKNYIVAWARIVYECSRPLSPDSTDGRVCGYCGADVSWTVDAMAGDFGTSGTPHTDECPIGMLLRPHETKPVQPQTMSGDVCIACGSPNLRQSGSCRTCNDCGESQGGCG